MRTDRDVRIERRARDFYERWRHRVEPLDSRGSFDRLQNAERQAWIEIAESSYDDPECVDCGMPNICDSDECRKDKA